MMKTYQKPEKYNTQQIHKLVEKLNIAGFCGIGAQGEELFVLFEGKESLTSAEQKKLDAVFKNYVFVPDVVNVRLERKPLLEEADWRINKAEDLGEDTTELRKYRQALRDVTSQDLSELKWPEKPWE